MTLQERYTGHCLGFPNSNSVFTLTIIALFVYTQTFLSACKYYVHKGLGARLTLQPPRRKQPLSSMKDKIAEIIRIITRSVLCLEVPVYTHFVTDLGLGRWQVQYTMGQLLFAGFENSVDSHLH